MIHPRLLSAVAEMVAKARTSGAAVPLIGISGAQGSGKSTLARAAAAKDMSIVSLSLDDAYLSRPSGKPWRAACIRYSSPAARP